LDLSQLPSIKIVARLDANNEIGMAHVVRLSVLLSLLPFDIELTVFGDIANFDSHFPNAKSVMSEVSPENFQQLMKTVRPRIFVSDHPKPERWLWTTARALGTPLVIAIDDFGGQFDADIIVNGTVLEEYHHYSGLPPHAKILAGADYALIKDNFRNHHWNLEKACGIAIIVGSGDRATSWSHQLVEGLLDLEVWENVTMVVGGAHPSAAKLRQSCEQENVRFLQGVSALELASILSDVEMALLTGGMIVYEGLAVGTPLVVFPQLENLVAEARWFEAQECLVNLGYSGGIDKKILNRAIRELRANKSVQQKHSANGKKIIDGKGMRRVAEEVARIINTDIL
jgi:spore coat polysaccharide biosynthesis predicted glycosyltransferase SpsG